MENQWVFCSLRHNEGCKTNVLSVMIEWGFHLFSSLIKILKVAQILSRFRTIIQAVQCLCALIIRFSLHQIHHPRRENDVLTVTLGLISIVWGSASLEGGASDGGGSLHICWITCWPGGRRQTAGFTWLGASPSSWRRVHKTSNVRVASSLDATSAEWKREKRDCPRLIPHNLVRNESAATRQSCREGDWL